MLRSGTAIGALVAEAHHAQSSADFLNKMNVALKGANETFYWLIFIERYGLFSEQIYKSISIDCKELIALLVSIVKSVKSSLGDNIIFLNFQFLILI